ncbi:hypothetical protein WA538_005852 [Blastocystis sp. DL]
MNKNLFEILIERDCKPFDTETLRILIRQLLCSLGRMHSCQIIHTDIKPENVMFYPIEDIPDTDPDVVPNYKPDFNHLCLIDFGSVSSSASPKRGLITTRTYRAPEVILDLEWSFPCDMWSLGCMAYELGCGRPLFQTHRHFFGNREHLALINKLLGPIPQSMLAQLDPVTASMFDNQGVVMWPPPVTKEIPEERQPGGWASPDVSWNSRIRAVKAVRTAVTSIEQGMENVDPDFIDFVKRLVVIIPEDRMTMEEAVKHPFVTKRGELPPVDISITGSVDQAQ